MTGGSGYLKYLIRLTREVFHCYMDTEGNLYESPIGTIGKRKYGIKKEMIFKEIYHSHN